MSRACPEIGVGPTGRPASSDADVAEVAERLQLSEVSVSRKIRDGTIPAIRLIP